MQLSTPSGTPSASENQPMSVICEDVRSSGGVTDEVRSTLIDGSISWFGIAAVSQWEIDEPGATGFERRDHRQALDAIGARPDRRDRERASR